MSSVIASGDRTWHEAGTATIDRLAAEVRRRAKAVARDADADAVHDLRTTTRRLRTAIELYGSEAPKAARGRVEDELRRVARRLGAVRDLDVLLGTLDGTASGPAPLRDAWRRERRSNARRLRAEVRRTRLRRSLGRARRLVSNTGSHGDRVATRAPSLIWDRFGRVLAHEVDPATAPPAELHRLRISAKKLRYTLETFEEALEPGATLIEQVTALQDAAGAMHDAIVAADRAQTTLDPRDLSADERAAIDAYADGQRREGDRQRSVVAQHLRVVRGRAFRESLGRAVASMGSVAPTS